MNITSCPRCIDRGGNCYIPYLLTPRRVEGRWSRPAGNSPRRTNPTGSYRTNSCLYSWMRQVTAWTGRVPPGHPPVPAYLVLPTITSHWAPPRSSLAAGPHKFHRPFSAHPSYHTDGRKLITSLNLLQALKAPLVAVQTLCWAPCGSTDSAELLVAVQTMCWAPLVSLHTMCWAQLVPVQPLY